MLSGEKMPNSPAVTSKCTRGEGERLPLEFFLHFFLARTRARQEVFVFSLHSFTRMPQIIVAQRVRGEGFSFFRFIAAIDGDHGG